jgi:type III pantothenate kinase
MLLLLDIGNTHTHVGLASLKGVRKQFEIPTKGWRDATAANSVREFCGENKVKGAAICSVVPNVTGKAVKFLKGLSSSCVELTDQTLRGIGIDYPKPATIGPDRLANALAANHYFGAPSVVVDFGTAVTFDVLNANGNYAGGIIAPGLAAMTTYLHEKTALLPKIEIREIKRVVGKSTTDAMLVGAVHGYRGLVKELIAELKVELRRKDLPVIATGGYAKLIAAGLPEISAVQPSLTLEGLRLLWLEHFSEDSSKARGR